MFYEFGLKKNPNILWVIIFIHKGHELITTKYMYLIHYFANLGSNDHKLGYY